MRRVGVAVVVVVVAGCGRLGFDALGDGGGVGGDAAAATCWPSWMAHTITVGQPRPLTELESGNILQDLSITSDGLRIYYTENVGGDLDVHTATRPMIGTPWVPGGRVNEEPSTTSQETRFGISGDGLSGVLASDRITNDDLYLAERTSTTAPFGAPTRTLMMGINVTTADFDPEMSANGLRVYWAPILGDGRQHIRVGRRAQIGDAFVLERDLTELDPGAGRPFSDPALSPDELVIAFASTVPSVLSYATRSDRDGTFGAPIQIPTVDSPADPDTDAELSADGCELYFTSNRSGAKRLYVATVQ